MELLNRPYDPQEVGDGLVMRSATIADADALAEFNAVVFGRPPDPPDLQAAAWTRDVLRGDHPTSHVSDHTIVECTRTGRIASSCLLISQTWSYDGIPFSLGRPELVGTHPDFRGRGLIGQQFNAIHQRSQQLGHLVQGLTGIPYFYRRFGYEPAFVMAPSRYGAVPAGDQEAGGTTGLLELRLANVDDLPLICRLARTESRRSLLSVERDEALWKYELLDRSPASDFWHEMHVIESEAGQPLGVVALLGKTGGGKAFITMLELADAAEWPSLSPSILRLVQSAADRISQSAGEKVHSLEFNLVPDHPFLRLIAMALPGVGRPFCWDVRVPDASRFLRQITPALERRLSDSELAGFTGDLSISFYERGIRLLFEKGRLTDIQPWLPEPVWRTEISFPERSFLYLLFGSRNLEEIEHAVPDARVRSDLGRYLINILFPKRPSTPWPIS